MQPDGTHTTAAILAPVRLMVSARSWRALAYLASGALIGAATLLYLPIVALATALVGVPLAAIPLGALERRRLAMIGRPVPARLLLGGDAEHAVHELTRSRARLVDAYEVERRRIERDLHDGAQQRLVALSMTLGLARLELDSQPDAARELIDRATDQAEAAPSELRDLIRGIHPRILTEHGLAAAVQELADRSPVPVEVAVDLPSRPPSTVESTVYLVIAEALANAVKHASATVITVTASAAAGRLHVRIHDDGTGGADPTHGTGLAGITARVAALDGTVTLSSPPTGTTIVHVDIPCYVS